MPGLHFLSSKRCKQKNATIITGANGSLALDAGVSGCCVFCLCHKFIFQSFRLPRQRTDMPGLPINPASFPTVPQRQKASLPPITSAQPARKVPRWGHTDRSSRSLTTPYAPKGAVPGRRCVTRWFCVATQSPRGGQLGVTPVIFQNSPIWSRGSRLLFFLHLHLARPYFGPTV